MRLLSSIAFSLLVLALAGCNGSPTAPRVATTNETPPQLASGVWSSGPACLNVTDAGVDLYSGCWHGRFSRPSVDSEGRFTAEGTYRFEAGPVKDETGQAARFTGQITGDTLTLTVERSDRTVPAATFAVTRGEGICTRLCG
jgi:hypothetical protein